MRRHRLLVRVAVVVGVVVALVAVAWVVLVSPALALDSARVRISGEGTVIDKGQVAAMVAKEKGTPLPRLDTVGLRERLRGLNGVRNVSISRLWPRGLEVRLVSREPVAAIPLDGAYTLVDVDAVAVAHADVAPADVPVIAMPWDSGAEPSRPLHAALVLLAAVPADLRSQVAEVSAHTQDDVEMALRDGERILWGGSQDPALKVKVLMTLRALPENAGVAVYDVSVPTMPVTR